MTRVLRRRQSRPPDATSELRREADADPGLRRVKAEHQSAVRRQKAALTTAWTSAAAISAVLADVAPFDSDPGDTARLEDHARTARQALLVRRREQLQREWARSVSESPAALDAELVHHADVVVGTCADVTLHHLSDAAQFDLLIVMDADRLSVTDLLEPLAAANRVVLVGDDRQLPPTTDRMPATAANNAFERLFRSAPNANQQ